MVISAHSTLLGEVLRTAEKGGVSLCILDTSPHSESSALDAAKVADLVVIPSRPAIFDLEAVGDTVMNRHNALVGRSYDTDQHLHRTQNLEKP